MEDSGSAGRAGLWQEMRHRWQQAAPPQPAPAWGGAELPSLAEILARLPRRAPAPEGLPCG